MNLSSSSGLRVSPGADEIPGECAGHRVPRARRPFDGPVVADLAAASTAEIAQSDGRWAAAVLAGWTVAGYEGADEGAVRAVRVAMLRDLMQATGLLPATPWWSMS